MSKTPADGIFCVLGWEGVPYSPQSLRQQQHGPIKEHGASLAKRPHLSTSSHSDHSGWLYKFLPHSFTLGGSSSSSQPPPQKCPHHIHMLNPQLYKGSELTRSFWEQLCLLPLSSLVEFLFLQESLLGESALRLLPGAGVAVFGVRVCVSLTLTQQSVHNFSKASVRHLFNSLNYKCFFPQ